MTQHFRVPMRGVARVRADANPNEILADLNKAFAAFKEANEKRMAALEKGRDDVVDKEKVERINADVGALNAAMEKIALRVEALKVGGAGGAVDPAKAEHGAAFERFFRRGVDAGLRELEVKAKLTTQSDPDGGYLVGEEIEKTIDRTLATVSAMRSVAMVMPISTKAYKKFVSVGGAGGGWVGEEGARTETATPALRELVFTVMEMYAEPQTTQGLLDDGIVDIGAWLAGEVEITFSELEGAAFVTGDGANKPRGLTTYDKVANASWSWGNLGYAVSGASGGFVTPSTSANQANSLIGLYYALKAGYRNNATWMMSDATMNTVRQFLDADGKHIFAPPTAAGELGTILGKPVVTDDNMPAISSGTYPIAFGDFKRGYLVLDRQGIRVLRDPFTSKPNVKFYTTKRVGGGVSNFEAIKLLKIGTS